MDKRLKEFLKESRAKLKLLKNGLGSLAGKSFRKKLCSDLSKAIRDVQEAAEFLGFEMLNSVSEGAASVLEKLSLKELKPTSDVLEALKLSEVAMREILKSIRAGGEDHPTNHAELISHLKEFSEGKGSGKNPKASSKRVAPDKDKSAQTDPATQKKADSPAAELEPFSPFNDVAARLCSVEPTDTSDLESLRENLLVIARDENVSENCRTLAAEAMLKIDDILFSQPNDPAGSLAEARRLVESAMQPEREPQKADSQVRSEPVDPGPEPDPASESQFPEDLPSDTDTELMEEFITESLEYIEASEGALLSLEADPNDMEAVNTVFRAFHTIKGTSGFLNLKGLAEFAHRAETLLSRVREREIRYSGGYADLALRSLDLLKELIRSIQAALAGEPMSKPFGYDDLVRQLADPEAAGISEESATDKGSGQPVDPSEKSGSQVRKSGKTGSVARSSVRVRTDRLDSLIDMVGELVIAHAMIGQDQTVLHRSDVALTKKVAHAGKIVRDLQNLSMSMRMIPLKSTFQKMARLVRDLSRKADKNVEFITEGEETEIDRNMVDVISDPLVHMVRNAVDHGIEAPEERQKNGKPKKGTVRLSAYHSGGNVLVELQDNGKGLNLEKIVEKAISKGLIESKKGMTDSDIFKLIFKPGFSTVDVVTDVSGRGVGMDVVRRNIETLRGRIDVISKVDEGSTFTLVLPLTLAITDSMLVQVGAERYIIPTINIYITLQPKAKQLNTVAGRGEMLSLRGQLMPLFRLHQLFNVKNAVHDPTQGLLIVVGEGDQRCALLVDELLGQQQVVVKSLGSGLGDVQGVSGSAILGDGRVGLILDTAGIVALARHSSTSPEKTASPNQAFIDEKMRRAS